jgi:hypothetical protein
MFVAAAIADLHEAESVSRGDKAHRLGIDGDRSVGKNAGGQVFFM